MKKIIAIALALACVLSLSVCAFAAGSPIYRPDPVAPKEDDGWDITDDGKVDVEKGDVPVHTTIPKDAVKTIAIDKATEELSEEDAAAFQAAYDAVKDLKDVSVFKFFWLIVDEEKAGLKISAEDALVYCFSCPGENVKVTVNGKDMKVVDNGDGKYTASLTETGAVAILCDAA